jgi:hypothetical protein
VNTISRLIACLIILASSIISLPASASEPVSQPVSEPATFSAQPLGLASTWVPEALESAGVQVDNTVVFLYTDTDNCGAILSEVGQGGCTVTLKDGGHAVLISPSLAYTAWGNHILFHELAHTYGANECEAEAYAHQFEVTKLWSYPECQQ